MFSPSFLRMNVTFLMCSLLSHQGPTLTPYELKYLTRLFGREMGLGLDSSLYNTLLVDETPYKNVLNKTLQCYPSKNLWQEPGGLWEIKGIRIPHIPPSTLFGLTIAVLDSRLPVPIIISHNQSFGKPGASPSVSILQRFLSLIGVVSIVRRIALTFDTYETKDDSIWGPLI